MQPCRAGEEPLPLALDLSNCGSVRDASLLALLPPLPALAAPETRGGGTPSSTGCVNPLDGQTPAPGAVTPETGSSDGIGSPGQTGCTRPADSQAPARATGRAASECGQVPARMTPGPARGSQLETLTPSTAPHGAQAPQLVELRLGGCSGLSLAGLVGLAPALHRVRVLDLDHLEALRRPPPRLRSASGGQVPGAALDPTSCCPSSSSSSCGTSAAAPPPCAAQLLFAALAAAGGAPDLAELRLEGAALDDSAAATLAGTQGPALRTLSIVGVRGLGDAGMRTLAASCPGLETLAVGGAGGGSTWTERGALAAFSGLTELRIARRGAMDAGALAVSHKT